MLSADTRVRQHARQTREFSRGSRVRLPLRTAAHLELTENPRYARLAAIIRVVIAQFHSSEELAGEGQLEAGGEPGSRAEPVFLH